MSRVERLHRARALCDLIRIATKNDECELSAIDAAAETIAELLADEAQS